MLWDSLLPPCWHIINIGEWNKAKHMHQNIFIG